MLNKREYTRFDVVEIQGKMTMASKVEIVDMSLGGVAVKANKRIDVGREYTLKLGISGRSIEVRGLVVRSTLIGMESGPDGEGVLTYAAGLKFAEGSEDRIIAFLNSVEHHPKEGEALLAERRCAVRFRIFAPGESVMVFPVNFAVKDITLSRMLIHADQPLEKDGMVPLELQVGDSGHLRFTGKVFSSRKIEGTGQPSYEVELTYPDLPHGDRALVKKFIDYLMSCQAVRKQSE